MVYWEIAPKVSIYLCAQARQRQSDGRGIGRLCSADVLSWLSLGTPNHAESNQQGHARNEKEGAVILKSKRRAQ